MKIEEARMKECRQMPAFVQSTSNANLIDAGSVQFIPSRCTANECMHWRWHVEDVPEEEQSNKITTELLMRMTLGGILQVRLSKHEGYCGLSGKEGAE